MLKYNLKQKCSAPREELIKTIDEASRKKMVYIHAPAGYGKTFSTRLWLKHAMLPSAWVSIGGKTASNLAHFLKACCSAAVVLQPENLALKEIAEHTLFMSAPEEFSERTLDVLSPQKCVLVFDDLHLVQRGDILRALLNGISNLPEGFVVFILSRAVLPPVFSQLMLTDKVSIISAEELKFDSAEIKNYYHNCGKALTTAQSESIFDSTGGWAIAINAVLFSESGVLDKKLTAKHLNAYLEEQVWFKWSAQNREFMKRTAVLELLSPELCKAVTGMAESGKILEELFFENAFLSAQNSHGYRFHHLFKEFLEKMLEEDGAEAKNKLLKKAGEWYYGKGDYYAAVEYFVKCNDCSGVTKSLKHMYNYNSPYASIEDTLNIIQLSVSSALVEKYPFLLEVQAWAAFTKGDHKAMEAYLDEYYSKIAQIILQNPKSAQMYVVLRCMDYRISLIEHTKHLRKISFVFGNKLESPSISQSMPFFHRGGRDFSEYAFNTEENLELLRKTIGKMVKEELNMIINSLRAGISYEKGHIEEAYSYAVSANADIRDEFAPELKFCAMMILAEIMAAQNHTEDLHKFLESVSRMIERDKAYYLDANFKAYKNRLALYFKNANAAASRLQKPSEPDPGQLTFHGIYRHFMSARAYIAAGEHNAAVLFLNKLLNLAESYRRPLDIIEARILLAIAYWKKGGGFQRNAISELEKAIETAYPYGYVQLFVNEGGELSVMLQKIQKRMAQMDYTERFPVSFVKVLHMKTIARSDCRQKLTGETIVLKFTDKQKAVMKLMCEGYGRNAIAENLEIKPSSVKSHMELIYKKLDVYGAVEAVMKVKELGLLAE
ncbi:MAG: LuxR C-terminal-related transcriptional regulator [Oscillospiraceae bacterium]|nr:LuxR C-terminal-related transcriptional regulator [Oscillospiraceae bacterium]